MATKKDKQRKMLEARRKMLLESRKRCDQRKFESGLIRKSIWVPAQFEQNLMDFVRQLTEMHEVNMSNKRA